MTFEKNFGIISLVRGLNDLTIIWCLEKNKRGRASVDNYACLFFIYNSGSTANIIKKWIFNNISKYGARGDEMEQTLKELEREALLLAFGKGDWARYWYLKGKAEAETAAFIAAYKEKNF